MTTMTMMTILMMMLYPLKSSVVTVRHVTEDCVQSPARPLHQDLIRVSGHDYPWGPGGRADGRGYVGDSTQEDFRSFEDTIDLS